MIQKIRLQRGQILTLNIIIDILNRARSTYDYARFDLFNKYYLMINYNRDKTISISTNTYDIGIRRQIEFIKTAYTQARIAEFVFNTINVLSKK